MSTCGECVGICVDAATVGAVQAILQLGERGTDIGEGRKLISHANSLIRVN